MPDEANYDSKIEALVRCPKCDREMRLFGVEKLNESRDLYTFECDKCGYLQTRGVRIG